MNWPSRQRGGRWSGMAGLVAPELQVAQGTAGGGAWPGVQACARGWSGNDAFPGRLLLRTHPLSARGGGGNKAKGHGSRAPEMATRERAGGWEVAIAQTTAGWVAGSLPLPVRRLLRLLPVRSAAPSPPGSPRPSRAAGRRGRRRAALRASARVPEARLRVRRPRPGTLP